MIAKNRAANRKPTLRDAQKAHTRQRILDAARTVFFRDGFYGATIDQIVAEAGASRPTFYLHFRDKEEILAELMAAYMARTLPYMERLPAPEPTVEQLKEWLREVGAFLRSEEAVASVLTEVSAHRQGSRPRYGLALIEQWVAALGRRAPAFAAAARKSSPDIEARARAQLLIIEIAWAGENVSMHGDSPSTAAALEIVATALHDFLNDPRFHSGASNPRKARSGRAAR